MRPLGPGPLVVLGLVGLVGGWLVRPMSIRAGNVAPSVPPVSIGLIFFAAAIVAMAAYFTWRTVHRERKRLPTHQAVNRLVLARACALVGATVLGGYLGNAISHLGVGEGHALLQLWLSLAAAVGGAVLTTAGLLLERACRVPKQAS
ncbi:MAG TPA: DUF3180 domain-containing protein [Marmoricola sp.]|jgi:cytochrome bd-type quinol oxidase subunit 2|nr:DUF3180 domain-containing protein [Marmoricola sp.]